MGAALSLCIVDDSWEPEEVFIQKILKRYLDSGEAKLSLAIATPPDEQSLSRSGSAARTVFSPAERIVELWVETLQVAKGWAPLRWRYGNGQPRDGGPRGGEAVGDEAASSGGKRGAGTQQPSGGLRFWRAKVVAALASGDERSQWCLLQVAVNPGDRTMDNSMQDRADALKTAAFAHSFNQRFLLRDIVGGGGGLGAFSEVADLNPPHNPGSPNDKLRNINQLGITVCVPTVCKVLQSPVPQFFARGDSIQLLPYTASDVTKFIFDGHEDFLEIPHAFFHFVTWSTGGNETVTDLQGNEEENGSVTLVNPCMPRPAAFGPGQLWDRVKPGGGSPSKNDIPQGPNGSRLPPPSPQMFEMLHPRCGQLCRAFDPDRRARPVRRHCGMPASCGLNHPAFGGHGGPGGPGSPMPGAPPSPYGPRNLGGYPPAHSGGGAPTRAMRLDLTPSCE